ncbi:MULTISPECIES: outer membrane beta-barrel protein [unclassified Chelatococcus]|uniref:outer membrane beta-barrel protein n=1 Tax=unclassified Chelatococcus TaxID=2638111 RepID=UPI001BCCB99A|nr:outer membrane beta-barrel protein [Chelatococcus sp.]MBS7696050.1 outer membrane beta-barrel protein [Chelatococcus sp. YT9]MBX3558033.1 outer membrane beta-barrel protein [Chelatococcus sp.]
MTTIAQPLIATAIALAGFPGTVRAQGIGENDAPFQLMRGSSGPFVLPPPSSDQIAPFLDPSPMLMNNRDLGSGPLQASSFTNTRRPTTLANPRVHESVYADLGASAASSNPTLRRRRQQPIDPYEQLGLMLGGLKLLPAIEADVGYDSNPRRIATGVKGSTMVRTMAELKLESDWLRHSLTGTLRGSYDAFPGMTDVNRPSGTGRVNLRIDVLRGTQIESEGRYAVTTQQPGNPNLPNGVVNQPITTSFGGTLGLVHTFNRLTVGLYGDVDRSTYGNAKLADGTSISQEDRNYTQYAVRLRTGYELSPFLTPFVEGRLDKRRYDEHFDSSGYARNSNGVGLRVGTAINLSGSVTGEVAAGLEHRVYDDPRLADLNGPIGEASLVWTATPLTKLRLRASSSIGETSVVGSSGVIVSQAGAEVEHALRRNLTVTGALAFSNNNYQDVYLREHGMTGSVRLDWKLTRTLAFRASFTHERLDSTSPGSDYTANIFLVGLRLQR